jgi:uncharacterized protein (DUF2252 family)
MRRRKTNKPDKPRRKSDVERFRLAEKELYDRGRALRKKCPRGSHAVLEIAPRDPVDIHIGLAKGRIDELLPIRYERILESAFTHFRGSAAIMAHDLAQTPATGLDIQICGDCHLLNFGGFATPERKIIFDINDFDETVCGPWEWDVKRLAASIAVAATDDGIPEKESRKLTRKAVMRYAESLRRYARKSALQLWYADIAFDDMVRSSKDPFLKKRQQKRLEQATERTPHEKEFSKMTVEKNGKIQIAENPPLLYHLDKKRQETFMGRAQDALSRYKKTLSDDRQVLLENYVLKDVAMKIVGVGSVGTYCGIFLMVSETGDPLFLQFKEAWPSVCEPYLKDKPESDNGRRIVHAQRLMQSASDIFLGFTSDGNGHDYYIRQMRDAKIKPELGAMGAKGFGHYTEFCARALAQAHARSGQAAVIAGYLGSGKKFARAITDFASAYEKLNEADYRALRNAAADGLLKS